MKNKIVMKSYQRKSGTNEFHNFLGTLDKKAYKNLQTVLNNIQQKGALVARKNQWMTNIRNTGLFEIRSNIGRNQQRGLGYYDKQTQIYVVLTGFNKKDQRLNGDIIDYGLKLKKEAIFHINKDKKSLQPIYINHIKNKPQSKMDTNPTIKLPIANQQLIKNIKLVTNGLSNNEINQELHLKPNELGHLINSPQIQNLEKLCKYLNMSIDDLFQYTKFHQAIPDNPIWHNTNRYAQENNLSIRDICGYLHLDLAKMDRQIPINVLFKLADRYHITLNQLFNLEPITKNSPVISSNQSNNHMEKPRNSQIIINENKDLDANQNNDINNDADVKTYVSDIAKSKLYDGLATYNLVSQIILSQYRTRVQYFRHVGLNNSSLSNLRTNRSLEKIIKLSQVLQTSVHTLLTYNLKPMTYTNTGFSNLHQSPILEYLQTHGYNGKIAQTQLLEQYELTYTKAQDILNDKSVETIIDVAYSFDLKIDNLINKELISRIPKYKLIPKSKTESKMPNNQIKENKSRIDMKTNLIVKDDTNMENKNERNVEIVSSPETNQNTQTSPDSRLQRLFNDIEQLDANKILILNDLVQSWK